MPTPAPGADRRRELTAWLTLLAVAAALQLLLALNTLYPYVIESGDNGSILYIVAQWLHPQAFVDDVMLSVPETIAFYRAAPMWPIYALGKAGFEPGVFFVWLCFPVALLQMAGFYLLGKQLQLGRAAAVALALISLPTVFTIAGDLWGLGHSPLFRSIFGATLPWLLLALARWRGAQPYGLMALCALATYMHLPSGPPVALAVLGASALHALGAVGWRRALLHHTGAGLLYLLLVLPYAASFSANYAAGDEQLHSLFANSPYADVGVAVDHLVSLRGVERMAILVSRVDWLSWSREIVPPVFAVLFVVGNATLVALCALWAGPRRWRAALGLADRDGWFLCAAVFVGVVALALGISALDQAIAAAAGRGPLQLDFVRGTRFLVPGAYLGVLLLLAWAARRRPVVAAVGSALIAATVWLFAFPSTSHGLYRLSKGQSVEDESLTQLGRFILDYPPALKHTPVTPVLRYDYQSSALRYVGQLPLTFNRKDNNFISYSGVLDLAEHRRRMDAIDAIRRARREPEVQAPLIAAFVDKLGSDYVVIDRRTVLEPSETALLQTHGYERLYQQGLFALLRRSAHAD